MCQTITTYNCAHRIYTSAPCKTYTTALRKSFLAPPKPPFFRSLFCISSRPSPAPHCTLKPGHQQIFTPCPSCTGREAHHLALKAQETEHRIARARAAHNRSEKQRLQERRRSDRKMAFRCTQCAAERRRPDQMSRAANGGLCCARGIDEFEALETERGYTSPPAKNQRDYVNADYDADAERDESGITRKQRFPMLRYITSTEKARDDAKAAANTYGWDRRRQGSVALEPSLVTGFVSNPGSGTDILGTRPIPEQPKYEDLGIDLRVWRQMQDVKLGAQGRAPPPPEKPLPLRPLELKERRGRQIPRKPVSLLLSSPLSPQGQTRGKSAASIMNGELRDMIEDTMLDFQLIPEPRYRY